MFSLIYDFFLFLWMFFTLPYRLYLMVFKGKYRNSFWERFGFCIPKIEKRANLLIWIHAVSVGETKAVAPLAKKMKEANPSIQILVSSGTETGHAIAQKMIPFADGHYYLPVDFSWNMKRMMKRAKPDLLILCETDFWFHLLHYAKKEGARVVVVNGKISEKSEKRFERFSFYTHLVVSNLDLVCVQNELYKKRFKNIGIPSNRIVVSGNLKFDMDFHQFSTEEMESWKNRFHLKNQPIVVVGSSHFPEEEMLLREFQEVWKIYPDLKLILVPRRPEKFEVVAETLKKMNISFSRYTDPQINPKAQVILIDAMGVLLHCYPLADIAIVAGSFVEHVGGHNILEPCGYGVPVLFGPYMYSQPELVSLALEYKVGLQVEAEQVGTKVLELLKNRSRCKAFGEQGLKLIQDNKGSVEKTFIFISGHSRI